ncbi:MAG: metal ABC transporter ATP-binding protein [Desulfurococcaceae archaeon]
MTELRVEGLDVVRGGVEVIKGLSFVARGPGLVQVLGPNGVGKTTLLLTILGSIVPKSGRILLDGRDVTGNPRALKNLVGYVPQIPDKSFFEVPLTAWELVDCCARLRRNWPRTFRGRREEVEGVLKLVGLPPEAWHMSLRELSGGQVQRVMVARALVGSPRVLLLDEPFSNIDPHGRRMLAELLAELSRSRLIIATSHDPAIMLEWTDYVLLMGRGFYAYGKPEEVLRTEVLSKVYGGSVVEFGEHAHVFDFH